MRQTILILACSVCFVSANGGEQETADTVSYAERVAAQRAIEEVYWNRRTWPQQNPGPKPAFDDVFSEDQIAAKVENYLHKSDALKHLWDRPLTSGQLQRELERIASQTCAPETLDEILDALGHDVNLVVETLVRPLLADRLIRTWYSRDARFHAPIRRLAEDTLSGQPGPAEAPSLVPEYNEVTWRLAEDTPVGDSGERSVLELDDASWQRQVRSLTLVFEAKAASEAEPVDPDGAGTESRRRLPLLVWSSLQERDDSFVSTIVLDQGIGFVRLGVARWPKTSFDTWWDKARLSTNLDTASVGGEYSMPSIGTASCTVDSWQTTNIESPPDARYGHSTVWTGTEMIVWGGSIGGIQSVRSGGRYDPALDSWRGMPTATPGRQDHVAVWTGTEMIVWGDYAEGARYDPASDSWETIPVQTSAPRRPTRGSGSGPERK